MNNSDDGKRLLVKRKHGKSGMYYLTPLSPRDLSEISEQSFDLPFLDPSQLRHSNTCGGLLCFFTQTGNSYLCNPTTKQFQIFPPKEASPSPNYKTYYRGGCVGYDSKSDDYKLLRIWDRVTTRRDRDTTRIFEVYSLRSDSWKEIPSPAFMGDSHIDRIIYVRGKCYWLSFTESGVISFDFSEESFSYLPKPRRGRIIDGFRLVKFEDEDLLGIVSCGRRGASYKVPPSSRLPLGSELGYSFEAWIWREGSRRWDAVFNVSLGGAVYGEGTIYGPLLFLHGMAGDGDTRGGFIDSLAVYDWTKKECKELGVRSYNSAIEVFCYVESSVALPRGKPINGSPVLLTYEGEWQRMPGSPYDSREYDSEAEAYDVDLDDFAANGFRVLDDIELEEEEQDRRYNAVLKVKMEPEEEEDENEVHGSGQLCGMAEMTGPVDFHRDVDFDFGSGDKRSGSFPVKWHFIKDLANLKNFRFTILHSNETDKRDIQRLSYIKGLRIHNIFKRRTSTTSLLDFMQEEGEGRLQKQ